MTKRLMHNAKYTVLLTGNVLLQKSTQNTFSFLFCNFFITLNGMESIYIICIIVWNISRLFILPTEMKTQDSNELNANKQ